MSNGKRVRNNGMFEGTTGFYHIITNDESFLVKSVLGGWIHEDMFKLSVAVEERLPSQRFLLPLELTL